ncbi:carboxylesterase/lipase family protein [Nannocystis bainbridge]|uniref:Carboxylic ester hydrolase n=1 Tax=Nannocystis bainbridge TaxID=2995303 RepID=A0ABT5E4E8_9BACT|nr:carboxylesterase family protein [Nannocystis bainbridge]MDC0720749.1 carboxylesterase family protein [Nannocystis bainbridge]
MVRREGWAAVVASVLGCSTAASSSGTDDSLAIASTTASAPGGSDDPGVPTTSGDSTAAGTTTALTGEASTDTTGVGPSGCGADVAPGPTIVKTTGGALAGEQLAEVVAFRGVRYAEPPVGALRFRPPEPRMCVAGPTPASELGPRCPQIEKDGQGQVVAMLGDEDCLTLNVWTPAPGDGQRPVLVFIHGGGNATGGSDDPLYDGAALATAQDVVVVTLNYRLGALGFLAADALAAESREQVSGNYGLLDQVLALRWVQDNIAGFGGDPQRVLLFGESAGAVNTCSLIGSPRAAGLFQRAIVQSGSCNERAPAKYAADIAGPWLAASGCAEVPDAAACLRGLAIADILSLQPDGYPDVAALGQGWGPHVDGVVIPKPALEAMSEGTHNAVPLVFGANADETAKGVPPLTVAQYEGLVHATFGPLAAMVLAQYPAGDYGDDGQAAYVALTSDLKFICGARRAARAADAGQDAPVFRYHFAYDGYDALPNATKAAFHGLELIYVFAAWGAVLPEPAMYEPNADDLAISQRLQAAWARFAATGDPGGADLTWPPYVAADDNGALLDEPPGLFNGVRAQQCDFWDMFAPG